MAPPLILFQETRISATPRQSSSVLTIQTSGRAAANTTGRKRAFDEISGLDETTYARKHLAVEGSVFFRSKTRFPRSFLWRVLNDRKLVEIQCVDLVQQRQHAKEDRWLTFRVEFKDTIRPECVAFADAESSDALELFALTQSNELFTVTLKRDLLLRGSIPSEFDASTCVKQHSSSALTFRQPYRLFAASSLEVYLSLCDGGFARFERAAHETGAQWRDTFFNEGGLMGTLRGFNPLKRRQVVRYGDLELEPSTLAAIAKSPDGKHLWTVGLDHTLRAWSTATWKVVYSMDLLNEPQKRDASRDKKPYTMSAEVGTLLQIVEPPAAKSSRAVAKANSDTYALVVASPKDHQFKFYRIQHEHSTVEDADAVAVEDMQEERRMIPPVDDLLDTNVWHLQHFHVQPGPNWADTQIWLRVRSGALCRTLMLTFDPWDPSRRDTDLETLWKQAWIGVDHGSTTVDKLKETSGFPGHLNSLTADPSTPSEKWQEFLLYPGRFSQASLEAALHIYRTGCGLPTNFGRTSSSIEQPSIEERLTTSIAARVTLHNLLNKQPDYERYQSDLQEQWQMYWSLLSHLHQRRHDALGLAYDVENGLPWSICADFIAPIRFCSAMERRCLNTDVLDAPLALPTIYPSEDQEVFTAAKVLSAAREFRRGLSASFHEKLRLAAVSEARRLLQIAPGDHTHCVQALFDQCGFEYEVTDEDFDELNAAVEAVGGLGSLDNKVLMTVISWLDEEGDVSGPDDRRVLNRFGVQFTVAEAQETLELTRSILLDLLALITFMAGGLEESELDPGFQPGEIYAAIAARIKINDVISWLAAHERVLKDASGSSSVDDASGRVVSLLEDIFIGDWRAYAVKNATFPELLTIWSKAWVSGPDFQRNWDGITAHIMGNLLKHNNIHLALDFERFLTREPWATYLRGRLYLHTGQYALASTSFREAGPSLSKRPNIESVDTAHLLSAEQKSRFGIGSSRYYIHVAALFEQLKNYSYTADFARLALQSHRNLDSDFRRSIAELDRKKSQVDSPAGDKVDRAIEELGLLKVKAHHDDILHRLFNALVQTGHFAEAYDALDQVQDPASRRSELKKLIETCVQHDDVPTLLSLPFSRDLGEAADTILLDLARRGLAANVAVPHHPPYHQILYAFRIQRGAHRGAAEILHELLERLRKSPEHRGDYGVHHPEDETLPELYSLVINTLACCGEADAWLLAAAIPGVHSEQQKRKLVTLADLRREYAAELDRRSEMMQGRFPIVGDQDDDDVDML